jgi:hypothetical protein
MGGFEHTRFGPIHVLWVVAVTAGAGLGCWVGYRYLGGTGCIVGGIIGVAIGHMAVVWLDLYMHRLMMKELAASSNAELRSTVEAEDWNFRHTMALLNLAARGEEVRRELPRIIAMLESDSVLTRRYGWDALRIVFSEEYNIIPDYDPRGSTEDCRRTTATLKTTLEAGK